MVERSDRETDSKTVYGEKLMRVREIVRPHGPIPVGKSTWWRGVKDGRFPQPIRLGGNVTAWRASDIRALIENGAAETRQLQAKSSV